MLPGIVRRFSRAIIHRCVSPYTRGAVDATKPSILWVKITTQNPFVSQQWRSDQINIHVWRSERRERRLDENGIQHLEIATTEWIHTRRNRRGRHLVEACARWRKRKQRRRGSFWIWGERDLEIGRWDWDSLCHPRSDVFPDLRWKFPTRTPRWWRRFPRFRRSGEQRRASRRAWSDVSTADDRRWPRDQRHQQRIHSLHRWRHAGSRFNL